MARRVGCGSLWAAVKQTVAEPSGSGHHFGGNAERKSLWGRGSNPSADLKDLAVEELRRVVSWKGFGEDLSAGLKDFAGRQGRAGGGISGKGLGENSLAELRNLAVKGGGGFSGNGFGVDSAAGLKAFAAKQGSRGGILAGNAFNADSSAGLRGFAIRQTNGARWVPGKPLDVTLRQISRSPEAGVIRQAVGSGTARASWTPLGMSGARPSDQGVTLAGIRKLHSSVQRSPSSAALKCHLNRGFWGSELPSAKRVVIGRNLSGGSWAERWKGSVGQLKQAVNIKPKVKAGEGASAKTTSANGMLSGVAGPVRRTFAHYREAVGLQIEAFWKRNYLVVVAGVGLGVVLVLWRLMFGIASTFVSLSEGMAKFGFLALAAAMVILAGVIVKARFTINPDSVYRIAMRRLNTSAALLEVMGAPLSGTDLRAYIMSGGGFRLKNFRPRLAGKRCFVIFPIRGSDRKGLVSIEVKKKKGQYNFKLLAVDVPTAGADQRLYIVGDEAEYKVGGGLMSELRDPIVKAMAAQKEFEDLDLREYEEDEKKEMEAEEAEILSSKEKLVKENTEEERDRDRSSKIQMQAEGGHEKPQNDDAKGERSMEKALA